MADLPQVLQVAPDPIKAAVQFNPSITPAFSLVKLVGDGGEEVPVVGDPSVTRSRCRYSYLFIYFLFKLASSILCGGKAKLLY